MSIKAIAWAGEQDPGDPIAKLILLALCEHYNEETEICYPGKKTLMKWAICSSATVKRKLLKLADEGWIEVSRNFDHTGRQTANVYKITAYELQKGGGAQAEPLAHSYEPGEGLNCEPLYKNRNKEPEYIPLNPPKGEKDIDPIQGILGTVVSQKTAKEIIEFRKKRKKPLSERAARSIARELAKTEYTEQAVDEWFNRGWLGFKAEWLDQNPIKKKSGPDRSGVASIQKYLERVRDAG